MHEEKEVLNPQGSVAGEQWKEGLIDWEYGYQKKVMPFQHPV